MYGTMPSDFFLNQRIFRRFAPYPPVLRNYQFTTKSEVDQFSTTILKAETPVVCQTDILTTETPDVFQTDHKSNVQIQQRSLPPFISNLWIMLSDENIKCIKWAGADSFMVSNTEELTRDVVHVFKHNRLSSFTLQLSKYKFAMVKSMDVMEWSHTHLKRRNYETSLKFVAKCLLRIRSFGLLRSIWEASTIPATKSQSSSVPLECSRTM